MGGKLRWYANRLRSMSAAEILHRLRERHLRRTGRRIGAADLPDTSGIQLRGLAFDADRFARISAEALPDWRAEVARARAGEWHCLGLDWPKATAHGIWHLDPVSGDDWPAAPYCFDIDYRHQARRGDIKYVWEVNRLQILPVAAALWRAEGDTGARDFALGHLTGWLDANPPYRGVNWASGIELALRVASILATVSVLGPETLPADLSRRVVESLAAHHFWLLRYPSRYSSANNHRIAELAAIYILGRVMPELAAREADRAIDGLFDEALRQIHPDGVGAEQSPSYTAFSLEWILLALSVAREAGDPVPDAVRDRLAAAGAALRLMMDDAGQVPHIGDDDEGRVFLSGASREADHVALVLSSLAATLETPDLAPPRDRAHLRQIWLGRSKACATAPERAVFLDAGGYSVLRGRVCGRNSMIAMDHGPLGYLAIAAHGHADALSVWWHLEGEPVLVDAGTWLYHSGGAGRDRFRGTAAHNTLCLDEEDQSRISGAFNWSRKARAWRMGGSASAPHPWLEAAHDGYAARGVEHRRRLSTLPDGYLLRDRLHGRLANPGAVARVSFLLHPSLSTRDEGAGVTLSLAGAPLARIAAGIGPADAEAFPTETAPARLTVESVEMSPGFGLIAPTSALVVTLDAAILTEWALFTRLAVVGPPAG